VFDQANTLRKIMQEIEQQGGKAPHQKTLSKKSATNVLAVTGGKGGIGKSVTSANLATSLAQCGHSVLLVDTDMGLANLDVLLGVSVRATLEDVLRGEAQLSDIVIPCGQGLDLLPSSSGTLRLNELERIAQISILDRIGHMEQRYDCVVVDTPAGVSRTVQNWATLAQHCLVVCSPEPTSLADAYATMKILHAEVGLVSFRLLVNMVHDEREALRVYDKLASVADEYLGVSVHYLGFVAHDDAVKRAVRDRTPVVTKYPFSPASANFRNVAQQVISLFEQRVEPFSAGVLWEHFLAQPHSQARL
jgi:flagellar biosynthesis protein FlhG